MRRVRGAVLASVLLLAGCAGGEAGGDPGRQADGTWVGRLQTSAGVCPDSQDSDLLVSDTELSFVPGDGVLTLKGKRVPGDQALHAQLLLTDMSHKKLPMVFDGHFASGEISGTYGTPTCRASITLHRPTHTAVQRLLGD